MKTNKSKMVDKHKVVTLQKSENQLSDDPSVLLFENTIKACENISKLWSIVIAIDDFNKKELKGM